MRAKPNEQRKGSAQPTPTSANCPRCRVAPLRSGSTISRFDSMTRVCASCGVDEQEFEQTYGHVPDFRFVLYNNTATERGK